MRGRRAIGSALAIGLVLAGWPVGAAAELTLPEDEYCGNEYWIHASAPPAWKTERTPTDEALALVFHPADRPIDRGGLSISVLLPLAGPRTADTSDVDVEDALHDWISLLNAFGGPEAIRPSGFRHPTLPTAAAELVGKDWTMQAVAVDARSGRGHVFLAALSKQGAPPSEAEREAFRRTVASLRFDPERVCVAGADGAPVVARPERPRTSAEAPPASRAEPRRGGFDAGRAADGCRTLTRLFVPVTCRYVDLDGKPALLVAFDEADEPAAVNRERFTDRIAAPYCYEAGRGEGAYPLVFEMDEHARHGEPKTVRTYSCEERRLGDAWRATRVERMRDPADPAR